MFGPRSDTASGDGRSMGRVFACRALITGVGGRDGAAFPDLFAILASAALGSLRVDAVAKTART